MEMLTDLFTILKKNPNFNSFIDVIEFEMLPQLESHFQQKFMNLLGAALEKYVSTREFSEF